METLIVVAVVVGVLVLVVAVVQLTSRPPREQDQWDRGEGPYDGADWDEDDDRRR